MNNNDNKNQSSDNMNNNDNKNQSSDKLISPSQVEVPLRSDVNLTKDVVVVLDHHLGFMAEYCNDPRKESHTIILNLE